MRLLLILSALQLGCTLETPTISYNIETDVYAQELNGRPNSIVIVHLEDPDPYGADIEGFQWEDDQGIPHIMLRAPLGGLDLRFLCAFNHEYAHVVRGEWHGAVPNNTCGPNIPEYELDY